ncbi:RsmD family RNA methyltransferase [uncultured Jatrophihabitans sp.]|uniref:RsmD family RNA methyltransferase n=1 Tax=uncultured Jatrophihabitans sp. TaxID=1610747 RepID=UPI0035CA4D37
MTSGAVQECQFGPLTIAYDERVLVPRPWTLAQSEWAAELAPTAPPGAILELCAGAGHIGLAAAVLADRDLVQIEADPVAAQYARDNAERAGRTARVEVRCVRLQDGVLAGEEFPIIVADPPYLPTADVQRWPADPVTAIDGGADGLDVVRACLDVAGSHLTDAGQLLLQIAGPAQDRRITELLDATPRWRLARRDALVIDDERAIVLIGRTG